jgi:hypothetical protein
MSQNKLHIWEVICSNPSCDILFHMVTKEDKRPVEDILCIECDIEKRIDEVKYYNFKGNRMFAGFNKGAFEYTKRVEEWVRE